MKNNSLLHGALLTLLILVSGIEAQSKFGQHSLKGVSMTINKDIKRIESLRQKAIQDMPFPSMLQPANGAINVPVIPKFLIGTVNGGYTYYVEVATDSDFYNIISTSWESFSSPTSANSSFVFYHGIQDPNNYLSGTLYYWRVMVTDSAGQNTSGWSQPFSYTTLPPAAPVGVSILSSPPGNQTVSWINVPFSWSPATGATSYQFSIQTTTFSDNIIIGG